MKLKKGEKLPTQMNKRNVEARENTSKSKEGVGGNRKPSKPHQPKWKEPTIRERVAKIRKHIQEEEHNQVGFFIPDSWNSVDRAELKRFENLPLENTFFPRLDLVEEMGLGDMVGAIVQRMGLGTQIFDARGLAYPNVTKQFLSTLKIHYEAAGLNPRSEEAKRLAASGTVQFKILDKAYEIKIAEFCDVFGFANTCSREKPTEEAIMRTWGIISCEEFFDAKTARPSKIKHPAMRYVSKVLQEVVFTRYDKCRIRRDEVGLMSYAVSGNNALHKENIGCLVLDHWYKTAQDYRNRKMKTSVCFGGLIAYLLEELDIDISWDKPFFKKYSEMDLDYLTNFHVITEFFGTENRRFMYTFKNDEGRSINTMLPSPKHNNLNNESLAFRIDEEDEHVLGKRSHKPIDVMHKEMECLENFIGTKLPSYEEREAVLDTDMEPEDRHELHEKMLKEGYSAQRSAMRTLKKFAKPLVLIFKTLTSCAATKNDFAKMVNEYGINEDASEDEESEGEDDDASANTRGKRPVRGQEASRSPSPTALAKRARKERENRQPSPRHYHESGPSNA